MAKKHKNEELVTRAYSATFRAIENEDERGVIEGTPIVFGQPTRLQTWDGEFDEIIDADALRNADLKDVCFFVNHDTGKIPVARSRNGSGTMTFNVDASGMHVKAKLDIDNNSEARALHSAVTRGDINGMSFMFRIKSQEWKNLDSEIPTRIIKEISIVHEVSAVNFPAYPQTSIDARSSEETDVSPLAEARKRYAEEIAKKNDVEIEKMKAHYLFNI